MPYRRLPNTDQARIRALKAVVVKGDICNVYDLAVSLKALTDARNFLTKFEAAQAYYADCFERQALSINQAHYCCLCPNRNIPYEQYALQNG